MTDRKLTASVRIPIRNRAGDVIAHTVVDAQDADLANQYRWALMRAKTTSYAVYQRRGQRGIYLHRLILGICDSKEIEADHINRDGLDNRRSNLRPVTHAQNAQNRGISKKSTTGVRNVYFDARIQRFRAQIRAYSGALLITKTFTSLDDAAEFASETRRQFMPHSVEPARQHITPIGGRNGSASRTNKKARASR